MKKLSGAIVLLFSFTIIGAPVYNLYNAHRAMRVDDILTVVVIESAKAGSQSGTNTSKSHDMNVSGSAGTGALKFIPALGASSSNSATYDGSGATSREGSLDAKISARVIKVLDNGDLVINGSKIVEINEEKEIIKVSGIVRPQDIESNNIIYSYNIADAEITYSGKGVATTAQRPGLFARIINWIF